MLMGYEALALSIYDDPALVTGLFGITNEHNKEAARRSVENIVTLFRTGAEYGKYL